VLATRREAVRQRPGAALGLAFTLPDCPSGANYPAARQVDDWKTCCFPDGLARPTAPREPGGCRDRDGEAGGSLLKAVAPFNAYFESAAYAAWLAETRTLLSGSGKLSRADIERTVYARLEVLRIQMAAAVPDFDGEVVRFVNSLQAFDGARSGSSRRSSSGS